MYVCMYVKTHWIKKKFCLYLCFYRLAVQAVLWQDWTIEKEEGSLTILKMKLA